MSFHFIISTLMCLKRIESVNELTINLFSCGKINDEKYLVRGILPGKFIIMEK